MTEKHTCSKPEQCKLAARLHYPICPQCTLSLPPENIGVENGCIEKRWVNISEDIPHVNPIRAAGLSLDPLKHQKIKLLAFLYFQGVLKKTNCVKWINQVFSKRILNMYSHN